MATVIRLLGPPEVERDGRPVASPRGAKAWGVLSYLLLSERPPARGRVAGLLFPEADDPLRALRWNLTELRHVLGKDSVAGDPLSLRLVPGTSVDVDLLADPAPDADAVLRLGGELLEGVDFDGAPAFDAWLRLERRHFHAATETLLGELALEHAGRGDLRAAIELVHRALLLEPFDEEHNAMLVRLLVDGGNVDDARSWVAHCADRYLGEFGTALPARIEDALGSRGGTGPQRAGLSSDRARIRALLDAGRSAISAGATAYGLRQLRDAAAWGEDADVALRGEVLVELGGALVHNIGDRSGATRTLLHRAHQDSVRSGHADRAARAARELAFVHVQLGNRERARVWLDAAEDAARDPAERARILGVRGMELSDAGRSQAALEVCAQSVEQARSAGALRPEAWSLSMIGRIALLRGDLDAAADALTTAGDLVVRDRWTAFAPWIDALRAEVAVEQGRWSWAEDRAERAYAQACLMEDRCWVSMNARVLARVRAAQGDHRAALGWVEESVHPDPWYLWVHAYALRLAVDIAVAASDARGPRWQGELDAVVGRACIGGMTGPEGAT